MASNGILITGGAGFVGRSLAVRLASRNEDVVLFDNLSKDGVPRDLDRILRGFSKQVRFMRGDVRDLFRVREAVRGVDSVVHLANHYDSPLADQDPLEEFEVNVRGTLNVLEALREREDSGFLLYASKCQDPAGRRGLNECSRVAAENYVREYARTFAMNAVVYHFQRPCTERREDSAELDALVEWIRLGRERACEFNRTAAG